MNWKTIEQYARALGGRAQAARFGLTFTGVSNPKGFVAYVAGDGASATSPIIQAISQITALPAVGFFDTVADGLQKLSATSLLYLPQRPGVKRCLLQRMVVQSSTNFSDNPVLRVFGPNPNRDNRYAQATQWDLRSMLTPGNANTQAVTVNDIDFDWFPGCAFGFDISLNERITADLEVVIIA